MPRTTALLLVCALLVPCTALAQEAQDNNQDNGAQTLPTPTRRQRTTQDDAAIRRRLGQPTTPTRRVTPNQRVAPQLPAPGSRPDPNRATIAPQSALTQRSPSRPTRSTPPPNVAPIDHMEAAKRANAIQLNFDKKDLTEIIQFVSQVTGRNFILPERVSGKITLLSNTPIPPDEVWNVFLAALDANNWALYPVGHYWKLSEKKQSSRANIPTLLEPGQDVPATEQMVTKLFKLHYVEADQMRNTLNQFTSRDSDFQIFPPDTLIISDLGLNIRRLERLIAQLDQPGGSEEIHIVQVQFASAQTLQQKLGEIFTSQGGKTGTRAFGIAEGAAQPVAPVGAPQAAGGAQAAGAGGGGPVQISKIIAEERTNKLIIIASSKSFTRVLDLIRQLDVPTGGGGVQVYYLQNAKAEDIASTLQALAQGVSGRRTGGPGAPAIPAPAAAAGGGPAATADLFSGEVKITADKTTNSLVVIASASDYRNLVKVIEKLDVPRREVLVEAVIMEVNLDNELDLGVSAHGGTVLNDVSFQGAKGQAPLVVGSELGGLSSLGGVASLGSLGGFLAGLQGPPITVPGLNISLPSFAILLNALQSSSDVNVISTPHVTMVDNTEGEITVGQNVPFQAGFAPQLGGLGTAATTGAGAAVGSTLGLGGLGSLFAPIQRQNVELRLRIKPQISAADQVRLEVDEQTEEIASVDKQLGPTTSKRTAKTTVVVKDQETVVLGGLIQERTLKDVKKIPLLGSMPVIGWLFRNETTRKTRTNLLLFLTPYIIRDQSDYRRIFERKMAERAEFVRRFYGEEQGYVANIDYERKVGPLTRMRRGLETERSKFENGGSGSSDERIIAPDRAESAPPGTTATETKPKHPSPRRHRIKRARAQRTEHKPARQQGERAPSPAVPSPATTTPADLAPATTAPAVPAGTTTAEQQPGPRS